MTAVTIQDMKNAQLDTTTMGNNVVYIIKGRMDIDDGDGGDFSWSTKSTNADIDGTIIKATTLFPLDKHTNNRV